MLPKKHVALDYHITAAAPLQAAATIQKPKFGHQITTWKAHKERFLAWNLRGRHWFYWKPKINDFANMCLIFVTVIQVVLQDIKKYFDKVHLDKDINWILPASLWISATVITPLCTPLLSNKKKGRNTEVSTSSLFFYLPRKSDKSSSLPGYKLSFCVNFCVLWSKKFRILYSSDHRMQ